MLAQAKLRNKKTGEVRPFNLYSGTSCPKFLSNEIVSNFDMKKLEVEYDYDTDKDQMGHSISMLRRELQQAVDFFVSEDPIKLVENVRL